MAAWLCKSCRGVFAAFSAKCATCGAWNMMTSAAGAVTVPVTARDLAEDGGPELLPSGILAWDRSLGGFFPGAVYLLAGDAGIGKSTLSIELCEHRGESCLYIAAEETREAVAARAMRVGFPSLPIVFARTLEGVTEQIAGAGEGMLVVVDSLQKIRVEGYQVGSGPCLLACVTAITEAAHDAGVTVILICHVNKELDIAGPKSVEHEVDAAAILTAIGDGSLRVLRCPSKNRFYPTGKAGWMRMTNEGLADAGDAARELVSEEAAATPGRILTLSADGLPLEVQAVRASAAAMQRSPLCVGVDKDRVRAIASVLKTSAAPWMIRASGQGELEKDGGGDLAIALAMVSAAVGTPWPALTVAWGEVTLDGRVLPPGRHHELRREVAADLGLEALCPPEVRRIRDAVVRLGAELGDDVLGHQVRGDSDRTDAGGGGDESGGAGSLEGDADDGSDGEPDEDVLGVGIPVPGVEVD
jgi:DNA repair protein RadA/Sms